MSLQLLDLDGVSEKVAVTSLVRKPFSEWSDNSMSCDELERSTAEFRLKYVFEAKN